MAFRKELLHSQNEKIKGEKEEKMKREKQDEAEFKKLQRKKELEQKIVEIEERRKKRE